MRTPFVNFELYTKIFKEPTQTTKDNTIEIEENKSVIQTNSRSCTIIAPFVGKTIAVYNGKRSKRFDIKPEMVGFKLGCFAFTKKLGTSIHNSEHNRKKIAKMKRKITQKKVRKTSTLKPKNKKKKSLKKK